MAKDNSRKFKRFTESTVTFAKGAKLLVCSDSSGPADAPPILIWQTDDEITIIAMTPPSEEIPAPDVLHHELQQAFMEHGVPRMVGVIVEAYIKENQNPNEEIRRGDLQRAFTQEVDPSVGEVLSVLVFDISGRRTNTVISYKYDDNGLPSFGEEITESGDDVQGAIADVISDFQKFVSQ